MNRNCLLNRNKLKLINMSKKHNSFVDFQALNEHTITFDGQQLHIKSEFGVSSPEFIASYEELKNKFNLKIKRASFPTELILNDGALRKGKIPMMRFYVSFVLYCSYLYKEGIDIKYLVNQLNASADYESVMHAESLAILALIYHRNRYKIEFSPVKSNADLKIDGISTELKVAKAVLLNNATPRVPKIKKGAVDISNEIILDISKFLSSQLPKAIKQGEMVFFDLSQRPYFSLLGLPIPKLSRMIEPRKNRIVFFETKTITPNTDIILLRWGGKDTPFGKVSFPDIHQFKGTYMDIDPYLWDFLSKV